MFTPTTSTATYSILAIAIAFEVAGTTLLAQTAQFTRLLPTLGMAACYGVAFYCLAIITSVLPVGIVYALWSGLGIVFIAALNFAVFRQTLDFWAIAGLALIIAGVVVINTLSKSVPH
ncbi:QacE family quaternary ammonium compound efflux SMR transporter [Gemmobacter lanyuensis]|uniref:QacE family quaternary ammonium compound efflux SMR transporter n=1 Tax=Gemmobacter lanyuensis TaxID=1054497 RepID=A0A918MH72_9RHOB|nr:SMR family transporter [Gemmobacter lanyuensis]GGW21798.1 QacE family quaternary ammonium compound efflux SMR transporter [Gemmobacter lanyuensis]